MLSASRQSAAVDARTGSDDDVAAVDAAAPTNTLTLCCWCGGALVEPVPLECLHDCCASCIDGELRRQQQQQEDVVSIGASSGDVHCPQCDHVSANIRSDRLNVFVAALVLAARASAPGDGVVACDICRELAADESGNADESLPQAAFSCAECGQFLCSVCERQHARFAGGHAVTPWLPSHAAATGGGGDIRPGTAAAPAASGAGRQCTEHRLPVDRYCFRCRALRCEECAAVCARASAAAVSPPHESSRLDDQRARAHVAVARRRLDNEQRRLGTDLEAADECARKLNGGGLAAGARRADESALLDRKNLLLAAVEAAFTSSLGRLKARHDALDAAAARATSLADATRRRAAHASRYCGALLEADDAASLLEQHDRLFTWLVRLQTDAKAALAEIGCVEKSCAAVTQAKASENMPQCRPPDALVAALTAWLENPNVAIAAAGDTDDRVARGRGGPQPLPLQEQPTTRSQQCRPFSVASSDQSASGAGGSDDHEDSGERPFTPQKPSSQRPPARPSPAVIRVGPPSIRVAAVPATGDRGCAVKPAVARSIAVTEEGHVLVAAGLGGLVELDGRGRQVSTWLPERSATSMADNGLLSPTTCTAADAEGEDFGAVTLVCTLEDGRAGAVVPPTRGVLLLARRGGDHGVASSSATRWAAEDGIAPLGEGLLPAPPSAVAFYGCAVLVAAPEKTRGRSRIALLSLPETSSRSRIEAAQAHFQQTVECAVRGVALTPCAAVVAGSCRGGGGGWVVVAYGYGGGTPLWRSEQAWPVAAICTPPSGSVVYVAAGSGSASCVVALSGDDGRPLGDVVGGSGDGAGSGAAGMALTLRGGCVAVLSADGSYVTLRPVSGWTKG